MTDRTDLSGFATGDTIGLRVTYEGGGTETLGPWTVPHDSDYAALAERGQDLGDDLLTAIARQKPRPVVAIEVVRWEP